MRESRYELYKDGELIGTYTKKQMAERFNISPATVAYYNEYKMTYKKHWQWEKVYDQSSLSIDSKTRKVMKEWDRVTGLYKR